MASVAVPAVIYGLISRLIRARAGLVALLQSSPAC